MELYQDGDDYDYKPKRKRGRPKAETPCLTAAEKRARNAYYERERRQDEQAAYAELAKAVAVDTPKIARADVLRQTILKLQEIQSIEDLKKENDVLQMEINKLMKNNKTVERKY